MAEFPNFEGLWP